MKIKKIKKFLLLLLVLSSCQSNQENRTVASPAIKAAKTVPEESPNPALQDGDIIFHTSRSTQSQAIQIATQSKYSHMGLIYQDGADFFVYEAVQPVKRTPLADWIRRGEDAHYVVKRLKNSQAVLNAAGIAKMKTVGQKYLGKDYDLQFEWSDDKIYCSELVWKIYEEAFGIKLGQLERFKDFDLSDEAVQAKVRERHGNRLPLEELVITPDRIFKSDQLETVLEQ